jgi:SAM-dependent methyltransferase
MSLTFWELARQGLCSIEGGYDLLSAKFDQSIFRTPASVLDALQERLPQVDRALDIGCGTGAVLERLPARHREGIDLSQRMLERARQAVGPDVVLWKGDFLRTYWEDRFDLITSVGALGHIAPHQQDEFFFRVAQALRPNGQFVTVVGDLRGRYWIWLPAWLFDTAMRIRNWLWRPTFVMYYLSFVLPKAKAIVERSGLQVEIEPLHLPAPFAQLQLLRARKLSSRDGSSDAGEAPAGVRPSDPLGRG